MLGNNGGNFEFTTREGRVITIKFLTLRTMGQYESRLQNRAIKQLSEMRDIIKGDVFDKMFSELLDKITSGHYAFGSELCQKSLSTVNGISELVGILCDITPDEAIDILMEEGEAFRTVFDQVIKASITNKDDGVEGRSSEKKS